MIRLRDLQNRVYSGKQCIRFEVTVPWKENDELTARFQRAKSIPENATCTAYSGCMWEMQLVVPRTRDKDSEVYNFSYIMPKNNLPLELIAATGLKYFQLYLKGEVESKVALDFSLGEMLEGM